MGHDACKGGSSTLGKPPPDFDQKFITWSNAGAVPVGIHFDERLDPQPL